MSVHALASKAPMANGWDLTTTDYVVGVHYMVRDGSNALLGAYRVDVSIPFGTNPVKANRLLREAVAAEILSAHSLTIDPSDIYCPDVHA